MRRPYNCIFFVCGMMVLRQYYIKNAVYENTLRPQLNTRL